MAVAREEIDSAVDARAPRVGAIAPPLSVRLPAPKLWRRGCDAPRFTPDDPATLLVTDFSREKAWTVSEERSIDDALRDMACAAIGALLVLGCEAVTGLVTAEDIQGRRALQALQSLGFASRREMQVRHVMIPWGRIPVLDWRALATSRVRHVQEWARNTSVAHALLVEQRDGGEYVRGLLSRAHVERSLGCSLSRPSAGSSCEAC